MIHAGQAFPANCTPAVTEKGAAYLQAALQAEQVEAEIRLVRVENEDQAQRLRFGGSPSFRAAGLDWWPQNRERYDLSCRLYLTPQGLSGVPTVEMLREQLRAATYSADSRPASGQ